MAVIPIIAKKEKMIHLWPESHIMGFSLHASTKKCNYRKAVLEIKITSIIDSPVYTCPLLDWWQRLSEL